LEGIYVEEIRGHFETVLLQIIDNGKTVSSDLQLLTATEEKQLLLNFNDSTVDYPTDKTIVDLFEIQAARTPTANAVIFGLEEVTYIQLNQRANQLANYLVKNGVVKESLVPICIDRSIEMIVGILGILKAGGAYVPIDPQYPAERISYMLQDTGASLVITSEDARFKLPANSLVKIISLDGDQAVIGQESTNNLQLPIEPTQLAYVIYTSGSTGQPKGAMNEHRGVVNRLCWAQDYYGVTDADAILQKTTFCFDVSVWELLLPLLSGAILVFAKPEGQKDNDYLKSVIDNSEITIIHFVPSMLDVFLADIQPGDCKGLKKVLCSGEALMPSHVILFEEKLPQVELHNLYGPTEAAIDVTYWSLQDNRAQLGKLNRVPIGKPVANTSMYILNVNKGLVPLGVIGQLHIGGVQVGRGYLNQPALTAEKFVADPFSKQEHARMYKTGDLGCWLPDGNIEYLGRIDDQVKIRGYRIELGEIENVLQQSGLVSRAIVLVNEDSPGHKRLVAYFVAAGSVDKAEIQAWLKTRLPEYMVPALWMKLKEIPLTSNGKVNKRALPKVDATELLANEYIAPKTKLEEDLAGIWRELLDIETVGIKDSFFELGGDSILTIQVVSRARRMGYDLQPKDIFIHQTIERLCEAIAERKTAQVMAEQDILSGLSGLLPIQQWYLETNQPDNDHFNQSVLVGIDKLITASVLENALQLFVRHHDALRFKYVKQEGRWKQEYGNYTPSVITCDLQTLPQHLLAAQVNEITSGYQRSLSLEKGELLRMVWMQTPPSEQQNRLFIVVHHLAIDGVSWRILLEDLELLLAGTNKTVAEGLGEKSSSYRQWYNALEQFGQSKPAQSQSAYWQKAIKNYDALPVDKSVTGLVTVKEMATHQVKLSPEQTSLLLKEVPRIYHTEINDILLAALARSIVTWTGRDHVSIGLEGHGREDIATGIDTTRTIGWFTNLYPLSLEVKQGWTDDKLIKSVKEQLRQVPDKGLAFGVLKYINKEPLLLGRDPWDIVFNYLGQLDNVVNESKWFSLVNESTGSGKSVDQYIKEPLSVSAMVQGGGLNVNWDYSSRHFDTATIISLAQSYVANLEQLIAHCMQQQTQGLVFTPSDFGLGADVSYEELDKFLEEDDSENIISF